MIGRLYINNIDAYLSYGLFVETWGYSSLIEWPQLKPIEVNSWPDEDGVEPDLSSPCLDSLEVVLPMVCLLSPFKAFLDTLKQTPYHLFEFNDMGIVRRLRLISIEGIVNMGSHIKFQARFADDFPLYGYEYSAPNKDKITGYKIGSYDMGSYGISLLEGTNEEIIKPAPIKKNLFVSIPTVAGGQYDNSEVYVDSKDVALSCFMSCSISDFWHNYRALLRDVTTPGVKVLRHPYGINDCYYKSCRVVEFDMIDSIVWCKFNIDLVFTMQPIQIVYLLLSEGGLAITTEQGQLIQQI